jgi:5'(3')-deoxyribonucleotidase
MCTTQNTEKETRDIMPTIYIDMDGVVADWETAAKQFIQQQKDINGLWPDEEWQRIRSQQHFYRHLPQMPRADELMALARRFRDELGWRLCMLTAIPHKNDMHEVFHDKIDWMAERWPEVRVHFGPYSYDKQHHCEPGDILVDDRTSNCAEWRARGGVAVQVTQDYALALNELAALFSVSGRKA